MLTPEGKNVVYLIGAGASARALPTVKEMPSALLTHSTCVERRFSKEYGGEVDIRYARRYKDFMNRMAKWSKEYGTIDTYARSLFLLNRTHELNELKLHLSMYFMLEEAMTRKVDFDYFPDVPITLKTDRVDTRYLGWLALLMDVDSGINPRVNIVSWNYDLQLEHAMALFRGHECLGDLHTDPQFQVYPTPDREDRTFVRPPSLIRLNGVAGHDRTEVSGDALYKSQLVRESDAKDFGAELFNRYYTYLLNPETMHARGSSITFAWEKDLVAANAQRLACRALIRADVLVVIGYSYPTFNRTIDRALYKFFSHEGSGQKRVVLQSRSLSPATFKEMMGQTGDTPLVIQETNLDQFHVPSELF